MSAQKKLRQRLGTLKDLQAKRIAMAEQQKKDLDALIEEKQREIDNLSAQLTIGVVKS